MNPPDAALPLRDIHLPAEPGIWPPAPGWWILAALLLALGAWLVVRAMAVWRRRRRRRQLLAELERAAGASRGDPPALAAEISVLLRRIALQRYPRREIASLTGQGWLAFLDRTGGDGAFSEGAGRILAEGPYVPDTSFQEEELLLLAARWIGRNA